MTRAYNFQLDVTNLDVVDYTRNYYLTRLFNSLSILFPVGEKFFCSSIRHYRNEVPELESEIKLFIQEEAYHSMQHSKLNNELRVAGYDIDGLEKSIKRKLKLLGDNPETNLIITTCLEIFTQYGAELLMAIEGIVFKDNSACDMWKWHAREEAGHGHRTIAHKVMNKVAPISNIKLALYFILCMIILTVQVGENYIELSKY